MKWTKQSPTKAGWYWIWLIDLKKGPIITEISNDGTGKIDVFQERMADDIYWYGPLIPPDLPKD